MSLRSVAVLSAVLAVFVGVSTPVLAQHEGHTMPTVRDTTKKKPADKPKAQPASDGRMHSGHDMMSGPLSLSMDRMGSGTTWIPDAVTLPSRHKMFGAWEVMAHGFMFGQYDHQSG